MKFSCCVIVLAPRERSRKQCWKLTNLLVGQLTTQTPCFYFKLYLEDLTAAQNSLVVLILNYDLTVLLNHPKYLYKLPWDYIIELWFSKWVRGPKRSLICVDALKRESNPRLWLISLTYSPPSQQRWQQGWSRNQMNPHHGCNSESVGYCRPTIKWSHLYTRSRLHTQDEGPFGSHNFLTKYNSPANKIQRSIGAMACALDWQVETPGSIPASVQYYISFSWGPPRVPGPHFENEWGALHFYVSICVVVRSLKQPNRRIT